MARMSAQQRREQEQAAELAYLEEQRYELMRIEMAKEEAERKAVVLQRALRGGLLKNALYLV